MYTYNYHLKKYFVYKINSTSEIHDDFLNEDLHRIDMISDIDVLHNIQQNKCACCNVCFETKDETIHHFGFHGFDISFYNIHIPHKDMMIHELGDNGYAFEYNDFLEQRCKTINTSTSLLCRNLQNLHFDIK